MKPFSNSKSGKTSPLLPAEPADAPEEIPSPPETPPPRPSTSPKLELPMLPELAMPSFSVPTPEEKIAYDPSARQVPSKDGTTPSGPPLSSFSESRTSDRKPLPYEPLDSKAGSTVTSPLYSPGTTKGVSFVGNALIDDSLPEVVTEEMRVSLERQDAVRREQSVRTIKPKSPQPAQPYTSPPETMTISPSNFDTVTPLHLLGDQPDVVDCPFCLRRSETKVNREASSITHALAGLCCLTTFFGVFAPYMLDWSSHVDQQCTNCNRRVARKPRGKGETIVYGTPLHLREVSRYPAAEDEIAPPPPAKV